MVTPEIRYQSELYLPITEIRHLYHRLYTQALSYPPILSSTPFHASLSWADCFASLPPWLQLSPNPADLLEQLLNDRQLLTRFLFYSFLPTRFNGAGFGRYPEQLAWLRLWLTEMQGGSLRLLDAACGSGEGAWELAGLLAETGWQTRQVQIEGWTLEPLEVWAAEHQQLPHDEERQRAYQQRVLPLLERGWGERTSFKVVDLRCRELSQGDFNLMLCNGLLGGPLLHQQPELSQMISALAALLGPGGIILLANRFHGGWKKRISDSELAHVLTLQGLKVQQAGEGLVGLKPNR